MFVHRVKYIFCVHVSIFSATAIFVRERRWPQSGWPVRGPWVGPRIHELDGGADHLTGRVIMAWTIVMNEENAASAIPLARPVSKLLLDFLLLLLRHVADIHFTEDRRLIQHSMNVAKV